MGIHNRALSERMQLDPKLTLDSTVTQARQSEAVKLQQAVLRGSSCSEQPDLPVGAVQRKGGRRWKPVKSQGSQNSWATNHKPDNPQGCSRCGKIPAHDKAHCPAKDAICRKCNKRGHFQAVCRSAKVGGIQGSTGQDDGETNEAFLGALECPPKRDDPWVVNLFIRGKQVSLSIDTGAEVSVISEEIWRAIGCPPLTQATRSLSGPDGRPIRTKGKFSETLTLHNQTATTEELYVVTGLSKALLGHPAIDQLNLIRRLAVVTERKTPKEQFPSLFHGLGKLEHPYKIELQDDARPFALSTPPQSGHSPPQVS